MSAAIVSPHAQFFQPFQCSICQTRFTRHENLKRHATLHTGSQEKPSFPCEFCRISFSRRDLRSRHIRRKHPEEEEREERRCATKRRRQGSTAATVESSGDGSSPRDVEVVSAGAPVGEIESLQQWDTGLGLDMISNGDWNSGWLGDQLGSQQQQDGQAAEQGIQPTSNATLARSDHSHDNRSQAFSTATQQTPSPRSNADRASFTQSLPDGLSPSDLPYIRDEWYPTALQIAQGVDLFFTHVSHFLPFLHLPTFDPTQSAEHLVLSMLCLAYQYGEDPEAGTTVGTGDELSRHCFHRARVLVALEEEQEDDALENLAVVQTYLLLETAAMTYLCGRDSAYGLKVHSKMIALARSSGLTQPQLSSAVAVAEDLDSLWRAFVTAESQKRTMFAVHQIDALWYQILSVPRQLSHLEIKHELPCPKDRWVASSAAEWAHRQLLKGHTTPPLQYADAVRRFLSSDAAIESIPSFDSYGTINITQFLLSSAREVSGWSVMTGRLSLERLETLKASLVTLGTFVHPEGDSNGSPQTSSVEATATWQMAMIELRIWSSTHTGGVVQGSVDLALKQMTSLASSSEPSYGAETAQATRPYIDWFLRYLDEDLTPDSESPWVILYAYKAFLIAWQLVRAKIPGVMQAVGVEDGDVEGATAWARGVFQRREPRQLGKLIVEYLDILAA